MQSFIFCVVFCWLVFALLDIVLPCPFFRNFFLRQCDMITTILNHLWPSRSNCANLFSYWPATLQVMFTSWLSIHTGEHPFQLKSSKVFLYKINVKVMKLHWWVSAREWVLFHTKWAICQLYKGENKLYFHEIMVLLCTGTARWARFLLL